MEPGREPVARTKATKEPTNLRKTGHNLTGAAVELCRTLSDLLRVDEGVLYEVGLRMIYDQLIPPSQKEAVSVILRAKGENLRNLRKLNNTTTGDGAGEGTDSEGPAFDRLKAISNIHRNSTIPLDQAIHEMTSN